MFEFALLVILAAATFALFQVEARLEEIRGIIDDCEDS